MSETQDIWAETASAFWVKACTRDDFSGSMSAPDCVLYVLFLRGLPLGIDFQDVFDLHTGLGPGKEVGYLHHAGRAAGGHHIRLGVQDGLQLLVSNLLGQIVVLQVK